jgi:membrane-associated phospholipid phosphatase
MRMKLSTRIIFAILILVICFSITAIVAHEVILEKETLADDFFLDLTHRIASPAMTAIMKGMSFLGSTFFMLPAYLILACWIGFVKLQKRKALNIAIMGLAGYLVVFFCKLIFHRVRPLDPILAALSNYSFPSGHSTSSTIFFGIIIYLCWDSDMGKAAKIISTLILLLTVFMIGTSRVYLGMHFPTDVLVGFMVGTSCLIAGGLILLTPHNRQR